MSYFRCRINVICREITSLLFLVVQSTSSSVYVSRDVAKNVEGNITIQKTLAGCRRVHLPIARALSRDDQVMASPTFITPPFSLLFSSFSLSLLFFSFEINLLVHNGHISAFPNILLYSTSQVILTDTSVPPLHFSSQRQIINTHHVFQVMSLAFHLHIDRHHGVKSH